MANLYDKASIILTANAYSSSTLFSIKPTDNTGNFVFARASSGSRINSNNLIEAVGNNVPRLQYSSTGSACPQFLFEPTRTNLIRFSETISIAGGFNWASSGGSQTTSSWSTAPDGMTTSNRLNVTSSTGDIYQAISGLSPRIQPTSSYVLSLFVKPDPLNVSGADKFRFFYGNSYPGNPFTGIVFDVNNKTVAITSGGPANAITGSVNSFIDPYPNGWYRIGFNFALSSSVQGQTVEYIGIDSQLSTNKIGSILVWGVQLELISSGVVTNIPYRTSYIKTGNSTVTRVIDDSGAGNASTLTNHSSSIGQSEGTVYYEFTPFQTMSGSNTLGVATFNRNLVSLTNNGAQINGSLFGFLSFDQVTFTLQSGSGAALFTLSSPTSVVPGTFYKIACAYSSSNSKLYINGTQVASSVSTWPLNGITGSQGPMNRIWLTDAMSQYWSGPAQKEFKTVAVYKTRLTDSELIALTS